MEMEGKSSMAAKMDNNKKKPGPTTLPVFVDKKQQQQQQEEAPAAPPPFVIVNLWTFSNAFAVTITFGIFCAYTFIADYDAMAGAEGGKLASALVVGMLWCSTPQAVAAALALLLPCHRWRLRLAAANTALALTIASHCMFAGVFTVLVRADPGGLFFTIFGTVDFLCFMALLRAQWAT